MKKTELPTPNRNYPGQRGSGRGKDAARHPRRPAQRTEPPRHDLQHDRRPLPPAGHQRRDRRADEGDTEPEPAPTPHLPPRVKIVPLAAPAPAPAAEPEPETLPTKAAADPTPPALPTEKHLTPASAPRGKGLPPKKTLYHFTCKDCGATFTVFGQYRDGDTVKCSSCGSTNEFKDSFASFDAYCDKCGGHVYGRTNSEDTEMVWTCRCRNDLILTWSKKLRKYTNGGK